MNPNAQATRVKVLVKLTGGENLDLISEVATHPKPTDILEVEGIFPLTRPKDFHLLFDSLARPGADITCDATLAEIEGYEQNMQRSLDNFRRMRELLTNAKYTVTR